MKIIGYDNCSVSNSGYYLKKMKEKGAEFKLITEKLKVYNGVTGFYSGGYEYEVQEYIRLSNGKRSLLCTTCIACADDLTEEAYCVELEDNEKINLDLLAEKIREYEEKMKEEIRNR